MAPRETPHPSETARQQVWELVDREKTEGLSQEEASELEHYARLEHIMRLAKARASRSMEPQAGGSP